ncbi:MAG: hypothetical protein R3F46_04160 [bacterium]
MFAALLLAGGCSSSQYVPIAQQPTRRPELGEIRTGSAPPVSGEAGTLSVSWELGTAPFRVVWTFSGGVEEQVVWDTVSTRSYSLPVVWDNPGESEAEYSVRVEISDVGNGYGTKTFNFSVQPD